MGRCEEVRGVVLECHHQGTQAEVWHCPSRQSLNQPAENFIRQHITAAWLRQPAEARRTSRVISMNPTPPATSPPPLPPHPCTVGTSRFSAPSVKPSATPPDPLPAAGNTHSATLLPLLLEAPAPCLPACTLRTSPSYCQSSNPISPSS